MRSQSEAAALVAQGEEHLARKSYNEARRCFTRSLESAPSAGAYRGLGVISAFARETEKALGFFDKALEIDDADPATVAAIGDAYALSSNPPAAIGYYVVAVQMAPDVTAYKERFVTAAGFIRVAQYSDDLAGVILSCLQTPGLDCSGMARIWYALLAQQAPFSAVFASRDGAAIFRADVLEAMTDLSAFATPYFLLALQRFVVFDSAFELFVTALRRKVLALPPSTARETLATALAHYGVQTDFVLLTTATETAAVDALRARIESQPARGDIAVYAAYASLHTLANAPAVAKSFRDDPVVGDVVRRQIDERVALQERAERLAALTPISDGVSADVRAQYEEFPYPRWTQKPTDPLVEEDIAEAYGLRRPGLRMLVAGCGTGRETAIWATALPEAEILAIDLSRASLAYAQERAVHFGIKNITFGQADILKLESLGQTFDLISCGGVLHHLQDPLAGWRVISNILKPGGLMRIALYSEVARRDLVKVMAAIREKGYERDSAGMDRFRHDAATVLPADVFTALQAFPDYYVRPMCRDLIFHVQEHRFDIPGIGRALDTLGLSFVRMSGAMGDAYRRRFPADTAGTNLAQWDTLEKENPDIFRGMYQFWCRKN